MNTTDVIAEQTADKIFDGLDDFSKWSMAKEGTAFTSYEDYGDEVCAVLARRARAWYCYQIATNGFNCKK